MLLLILIVVLVLALGGGYWGHGRYGYVGWSPVGLILLVLLVLWLTGSLGAHGCQRGIHVGAATPADLGGP